MSYTPTEWKTGDVITAPKLNNIEQGIVNNEIFVINATNVADDNDTSTEPTLDKTFAEISEAYKAGKRIVVEWAGGGGQDIDAIRRAELYSYSKFKETGDLESAGFMWCGSPINDEIQFIGFSIGKNRQHSYYTVLTA